MGRWSQRCILGLPGSKAMSFDVAVTQGEEDRMQGKHCLSGNGKEDVRGQRVPSHQDIWWSKALKRQQAWGREGKCANNRLKHRKCFKSRLVTPLRASRNTRHC